jgi:hypothetical protein
MRPGTRDAPCTDLQSSLPKPGLRLHRRWAGEEGIALVLSLLVMGVLTIATASIIVAVDSNERAFNRDRQTNRALNIAEAGLNGAVDTLKSMPAGTTSLPPGGGTLDGGTWSYSASSPEQDASNPNLYYWTLTSTGISPDGRVTRIVSTKVSETITPMSGTQTTTTPASPAYDYGFFLGDSSSDCTTSGGGNSLGGSAGLSVSVYIKGSLCVSGNANPFIFEPPGSQGTIDVYIGGMFQSSGNPHPIGESTALLNSATIVGGCLDGNHQTGKGQNRTPSTVPCSQQGSPLAWTGGDDYGSGVWAIEYSSTQNDIPKPTIEADRWYSEAAPGPATGCNNHPTNPAEVSSYPSNYQSGTPQWTPDYFKTRVLDNNGTRNTSVGTIDFLQLVNNWNSVMNSFDCRWYDADGTLLGRLAWTYPVGGMTSSNPGTLTIEGTVFIDGNLSFSSSDYAIYQGRGTIYVNGTVNMGGGAKICAQPISGNPCQGNYDPDQNLLEFVAVNAGTASPGFNMGGSAILEGVAFLNGHFNAAGSAVLYGPVIADTATMQGDAKNRTTINPPSGAPGAETTTTTTTSGPDEVSWDLLPGSWQQLK